MIRHFVCVGGIAVKELPTRAEALRWRDDENFRNDLAPDGTWWVDSFDEDTHEIADDTMEDEQEL